MSPYSGRRNFDAGPVGISTVSDQTSTSQTHQIPHSTMAASFIILTLTYYASASSTTRCAEPPNGPYTVRARGGWSTQGSQYPITLSFQRRTSMPDHSSSIFASFDVTRHSAQYISRHRCADSQPGVYSSLSGRTCTCTVALSTTLLATFNP